MRGQPIPKGLREELLEAALRYASEYGWSIIPIKNDGEGHKKAAYRWKGYQKKAPTPEKIKQLFSRRGLTGLGVVLGCASGGLWARDFDLVEAYEQWKAANPTLAQRLPAVKTKRGFQIFGCCVEPVRIRKFEDGELRGLGGHSVLPPSLHPSGIRYEWVTEGKPEEITPAEAGVSQLWVSPQEVNRGTEGTEVQSDRGTDCSVGSQVISEKLGDGELGFPLSLPTLLQQAQPTAGHQNHTKLFFLARGVKALEKAGGQDWTEKRLREEVFMPWYSQNNFLRNGQSEDIYWLEFLNAYHDVKYPLGPGVLQHTWQRAELSKPPEVTQQFKKDERIRKLVTWCRELQRFTGEAPFYLSCRTVAAKLGFGSSRTASMVLRGLVLSKILGEVEKGGPKTNRATRYRYLPPLEEEGDHAKVHGLG